MDYFEMKQFGVWHDRCAMKVGTDGVLLGAWCNVDNAKEILDVGCGSGLISLMLSQRNTSANILGIDIDKASVEQASENFRRSPFAERLCAEVADFRTFVPSFSPQTPNTIGRFDLVVSNPPFFTEQTQSPRAERAAARNATALPFADLVSKSRQLLTDDGRLAVILPHAEAGGFIALAISHGLSLLRRMDVCSTPKKPPRRTLLEFARHADTTLFESLCIHDESGSYTDEYKNLTGDFYVHL